MIRADVSSLMLRFRVSAVEGMDTEWPFTFLFFQIIDTILVRLLLMAPLLLKMGIIRGMLATYPPLVEIVAVAMLGVGFINETTGLLAAVVAVYLMIG